VRPKLHYLNCYLRSIVISVERNSLLLALVSAFLAHPVFLLLYTLAYLMESYSQNSEGLLSFVTVAVVFGRSRKCCQKTSVRSAFECTVNVSM